MERWSGKVAVVTGASSGIGEAIARELVAQGLKVAALARRKDRLQALESELSKSGVIVGLCCDVSKEEDVCNAFKWIEEHWGGVHIVVNNAGQFLPYNSTELDVESLKQMFGTNVFGLLSCTKEGLKSMQAHGIDYGHIININSVTGHGVLPIPFIGGYTATKHSVTALSEYMRTELGISNLKTKVTSISPGFVESEMTAILLKSGRPYLRAPAIAQAVVYALSTPPDVNISELTIQPVGETFLKGGM